MRPFWVIFLKEVREASRDRRTLLTSFLLPILLVPLLVLGFPALARRQEKALWEKPAKVAIVGEEARELIAEGLRMGILEEVPGRVSEVDIQRGRVDVILAVPPDYRERLHAGKAAVTVIFDGLEPRSAVAKEKLLRILTTSLLRYARAPVVSPPAIQERNLAVERQTGNVVLANLLPFLVAVWAVLGGMHSAVDVAAGEKERGTLESLLVTPPSRLQLLLGKFLAVLATTIVAILLVLGSTLVALRWIAPSPVGVPSGLRFGVGTFGALLWIAFLLSSLTSGLALTLSLLSRSIREAQQYLIPLYLLVALPGMAVQFLSRWQREPWAYLLPVFNTLFAARALLLQVLQGEHLLLMTLTSALYAAGAFTLAWYAFSREDVVFRA
ncbi:MAG: ABC transporter permease subunit [Armatimonadota bacterium]|nr:ABC transporter permease subunit [Armatimonadota bacterium]MDR5702812.1 ABC transporter permease subunit [Armatimonadota bacterium]